MGRYICSKCGASLDAGETNCPSCGSSKREYNKDKYNNIKQAQNKKPELRDVYYIYRGSRLIKVCTSVLDARSELSKYSDAYVDHRVEMAI